MATQRTLVGVLVTLVAALSLASAETPMATSRSEYDAFVAAFVMEQHAASCSRHAPEVYSALARQLAPWRAANDLTMRRLEAAARRWPLPGGASLDVLLAHIGASLDEYYAAGTGELTDAR